MGALGRFASKPGSVLLMCALMTAICRRCLVRYLDSSDSDDSEEENEARRIASLLLLDNLEGYKLAREIKAN